MRVPVSFAALCALAACASSPDAPATTPIASAGAPQTSRTAQLLARAGRGDGAPTQTEIERVFGAADITRQDGAGAALTYRYENCALLLLFSADARNDMRLAEAHPSARRAGVAAPSLEQCATEAAARRS